MPDFSIADWWMTVGGGKEPSPAEGFAAGQRMYESQKRNELSQAELAQRMELAKGELYIRGLNEMSNTLKVRSAISQRESQVKGFQEMSSFMSQVAAGNSWADPAARAKFWEIASRHPSIDADTVRQMDSSTFDEAIKRKEMADRYANGSGQTAASVAEFNFAEKLRKDAEDEVDPEVKQRKLEALNSYQTKVGLLPESKSKIETLTNDNGDAYDIVWVKGKEKSVTPRKTNSLNSLQKAMLATELRSINDDWKNMDPRFIGKDGKPDSSLKQRELDAIFSKYEKAMAAPKKAGASATVEPPAPTSSSTSTNSGSLQSIGGGKFKYIP